MASLEYNRLRVFRALAELGNFRRTAEALYISQPAVTQAIRLLEEELGTALFDRSEGRVRLTAAGHILLRYASQSEAMLREAQDAVQALRGEIGGQLTLAASTTIAQYILPGVLAAFARTHPAAQLSLASENTQRVLQQVSDGEAPLGLIEGPARRPDLLVEPWLADELLLVVPASHFWAGKLVPAAALQSAALLLREPGSGTRTVVESALGRAGLDLSRSHIVMQLSSTESLLACIEAGLGVGFVSRFAVERQRRLGTLAVARIEGLRIRRTLSLVQPRRLQPSRLLAEFMGELHAFAADHGKSIASEVRASTRGNRR